MTKILDSGNRTEFETGAVRDIQQGKGRFDLMPLDVMTSIFMVYDDVDEESCFSDVMDCIDLFYHSGHESHLVAAVAAYSFTMRKELPALMLDVAKHFENGALKYGEHNWQKGIPISRYIDSALRHLMKYCCGMTDENHEAAFVWNLMCATWTMIHKPELDDYTLARKTCD